MINLWKIKYKNFGYSPLSSCETWEKFLMWIVRTRCTKFLAKLEIKNVQFWGKKEFIQNVHYCYLWLLLPHQKSTISKNPWSRLLVYKLSGPSWAKYFGAKRYFFEIFIIVIVQNFKKLLRMNSKKKAYKLLGLIWGKYVPFLWKTGFFCKIFIFVALPYLYCSSTI